VTYPSDAPPGTGATAGSRPGPGTDEHVLAISLGQPEAFGELYARHCAVVFRYVAGRLGPDAADDLAAETFLAAFRRRHRFDPDRGAVRPWLFGIATNLVAQHHRGRVPVVRGARPGRSRPASRLNRARRTIIAALSGVASPSALTADGLPSTPWRR
jgi:hypothetical protein